MFSPGRAIVIALSVLLCAAPPLTAAESIGKAVHIKTAVTGAGGELAVDDPVHQDERIRTSKSGLGQFVFRDGTKLAVGWGSSVVIDKFVFDGSRSVKRLTLKAAKGTFRWISGNSKHAAYEILTPAGTIGVRGTVFDFYIGPDGTTAVVLLSGAASFCGAGGCRELTRRCDSVVARRDGTLTASGRVDRSIFKTLGGSKALPFLSGNQKLPSLGGGGTCGLRTVVEIKRDDTVAPAAKKAQAQARRDRERPVRDKPNSDHEGRPGDQGGPRDDRDKPVVDREKPPSDDERPQGDRDGPRDRRDKPSVEREKPRSDRERPKGDGPAPQDDHDRSTGDRVRPNDNHEDPDGNEETPSDPGGEGDGGREE